MTHSFRFYRACAAWFQAAVLVGLPFLRINGESAFRFDVPSLKLYAFGSVFFIGEAFFFLLLFLLLFLGVMLVTVLAGRVWCGWLCPQSVLSDFSEKLTGLTRPVLGPRLSRSLAAHAAISALSVLVAANLIWYFVSPYEFLADLAAGSLGPWTSWSWALFSLLLYLDFAFTRRKFCSAVCPYARFQSAFFDNRTLTIAFDDSRQEECLGCEACVRVCPAGIDIRDGLQIECVNCAECIDSCAARTAGPENKPLIGYRTGASGPTAAAGPRWRVIGLAAAFALIAALFAHELATRVPVGFWIGRDDSQPHHNQGVRGDMLNVYQLLIENRSLRPGLYRLSVSGIKDAELVLRHNPIPLPPNSSVRLRVYVFARRAHVAERVTRLRFTLASIESPELRLVQEASFFYTDRSEKGVEI